MMKLRKIGVLAGMTALLTAGSLSVCVQNVQAAPDPVLSPERPAEPPSVIDEDEVPLVNIGIWSEEGSYNMALAEIGPGTGKKSPQTGDTGINPGSLAMLFGCGAAALWYAGNDKKSRDRQIGK